MSETTLTQQLTELIMAKSVAAADLEQAALLTLDAMANAMAGRVSEPGTILLRWAGATGAADAERNAFLLGSLTHILKPMIYIALRWYIPAALSYRRLGQWRFGKAFAAMPCSRRCYGVSRPRPGLAWRLVPRTIASGTIQRPVGPMVQRWRRRPCYSLIPRRSFTLSAMRARSLRVCGSFWKQAP